jgi:hypothetical protein
MQHKCSAAGRCRISASPKPAEQFCCVVLNLAFPVATTTIFHKDYIVVVQCILDKPIYFILTKQ